MTSLETSLTVAACAFAGGVGGVFLHHLIPGRQISKETQDVVRLGTGMVSVLASLVLGLLIATAKSSYDTTDTSIRTYAADLIMLDETLRDYGDAAIPARRLLRDYTELLLQDSWPDRSGRGFVIEDRRAGDIMEHVREAIRALRPGDGGAQSLQNQAIDVSTSLLRQRWLLIEHTGPSVRPVTIAILASWIVAIFASFGMNAPRNGLVMVAFLICALSIGSSIYLILQLDSPFEGLLQVSSQPVRIALQHMLPPGR